MKIFKTKHMTADKNNKALEPTIYNKKIAQVTEFIIDLLLNKK